MFGFAAALAAARLCGAQQVADPEQLVLEGVPYMGPEWQERIGHPADFALPAGMRSVMFYLDGESERDYFVYLFAAGIGTEQLWDPAGERILFDNHWLMDEDPLAPIRRSFEVAGYEWEIVGNQALCEAHEDPLEGFDAYVDAEGIRERVCASLRDGRPVIAYGTDAVKVIAGYEQAGQVAVGWQHHIEDDEIIDRDANGYVRWDDWLETTVAIILVGEKHEPPPLPEVYRTALLLAVRIARTHHVGDYIAGHAAVDAWTAWLAQDDNFQPGDAEKLEEQRVLQHLMGLTFAEGRGYAVSICYRAADAFPNAADELGAAGFNYHIIHDLQWQLWRTAGVQGNWDTDGLQLCEPDVREHLREIVALTKQQDAYAIAHIERALLALGVPREEIPPAAEPVDPATEFPPGADPTALAEAGGIQWAAEGVPELQWAQGRDCTFIGALEAALTPTQHPYGYAQLMGYSGLAFRTRWFHNPDGAETSWGTLRWHPVSPHGEGPEEIAALRGATGWQLRIAEIPEDRYAVERHRAITDTVMSINRALPVIVGRNTDLACISGYNIHAMDFYLRDYQQHGEGLARVSAYDESLHSPFIFLERREQPLPEREALLEALRIAVRNGGREPEDGFGYGLDALVTWRQDLDGHDAYTDEERELLRLTNWWCLMHLHDARRAAVGFLETNADLVSAEAQPALQRATALYLEEAESLQAFLRENSHLVSWWGGLADGGWDEATRRAQSDLLAQAHDVEAEALAALAEVLTHEGAEQ